MPVPCWATLPKIPAGIKCTPSMPPQASTSPRTGCPAGQVPELPAAARPRAAGDGRCAAGHKTGALWPGQAPAIGGKLPVFKPTTRANLREPCRPRRPPSRAAITAGAGCTVRSAYPDPRYSSKVHVAPPGRSPLAKRDTTSSPSSVGMLIVTSKPSPASICSSS